MKRTFAARFEPARATGLYLTVVVFLTLFFLSGFFFLVAHLGVEALGGLDPRLLALLVSLRSVALTRVLWGATVLGDTPSVTALVIVTGVLLLAWGRRTYAALVVGSVAIAWGLESLAKVVVHRPRPPVATALVQMPSSFSFPSGHAVISLALCGVLAVLAIRSVRAGLLRGMLVALAALTVVLIGFSRLYLGVHWATDVLASWSLGAAWLSASTGAYLLWSRFGRPLPESRPWKSARARIVLTIVLAAGVLAVVVVAARFDPLLAKAVSMG